MAESTTVIGHLVVGRDGRRRVGLGPAPCDEPTDVVPAVPGRTPFPVPRWSALRVAGDTQLRALVAEETSARAEDLLGPAGAMIACSKSGYRAAYPCHDVIFNARVFDGEDTPIWAGDLDLTVKADALHRLADAVGGLVVRRESPRMKISGPDGDIVVDPPYVRIASRA